MSAGPQRPRQRLLAAMTEVAARDGYAEASVAEVIAAAAASRSTFYEHFSDRDDCFLAALRSISETLAAEVEAAVAAPNGPGAESEPARAALNAVMAFCERETDAARVLFLESLAAGRQSLTLREQAIDRLAGAIEQAWAARTAGQTAIDVPALGLFCGLFRLLSMRLTAGEAALHGLADDLRAWLDSYAAPPHEAPRWRAHTPLGRVQRLPAQPPPEAPAAQTLPRGRHGLPGAEVARSQRERIMAAVASESFEHGYANVTVTGIVAAASISRNVFYEQFSDKQEAAIAALQDGFERAFVATASSFFEGEDWPHRIWRMAQRLTDHYLAHPADAYLSFVELHAIGPDAVRLAHERLRVFTLLLEEGYRLREADAPPLPRLAGEALVASVLELGYRQAPHKGAATRPVLLGQQAYMCLAPFVGVQAASELVAEGMADEGVGGGGCGARAGEDGVAGDGGGRRRAQAGEDGVDEATGGGGEQRRR